MHVYMYVYTWFDIYMCVYMIIMLVDIMNVLFLYIISIAIVGNKLDFIVIHLFGFSCRKLIRLISVFYGLFSEYVWIYLH